MFAFPTSWFAISVRRTPWLYAASVCCAVASVMPQAPAFICISKSRGAIVVLPWGASFTP